MNHLGIEPAKQLAQNRHFFDSRAGSAEAVKRHAQRANARDILFIFTKVPHQYLRFVAFPVHGLEEIAELPLQAAVAQLTDHVEKAAVRRAYR